MRLALVADWLPTFGGAEHVVAALHRLWPDAPIFTTVANRLALGPLAGADIRTGSLQSLYRLLSRHEYLLPLMPRAVERIDLAAFDVIVSSSHAVAKGIIPPSHAVHVCYCHTPMRYAWEMEEQYLEDFRVRGPLKSFVKRGLKKARRWDLTTAKRVDRFIANSTETQQRIQRIYGRESVVIHPPVDEKFFKHPIAQSSKLEARSSEYFLALGRFVPYKRFDLLIELANTLKLPLRIAGQGLDEKRLKSLGGPTVAFLGTVPDDQLPSLYAGASAILFPQHEDAGLVPLEAMACGTPVIAYARGGVLDAIEDGVSGVFVPEQSVAAFRHALEQFAKISWDRERIRKGARRFSETIFVQKMHAVIDATAGERALRGTRGSMVAFPPRSRYAGASPRA